MIRPRRDDADAVFVEQAFGHLASLGHERIGLVLGPEDHVPSRRKLAEFTTMAEVARAWKESHQMKQG